jgi:DNA-binding XRE family transcriptional regulator
MSDVGDITKSKRDQILDDHFEKGKSYSRSAVEKMCRDAKKAGRQYNADIKRVDSRSKENKRPRSSLHAKIGLTVYQYRTRNKLNYTEMGEKLNVSRFQIQDIEYGCFSIPLELLVRISELVDVPLPELVTDDLLKVK